MIIERVCEVKEVDDQEFWIPCKECDRETAHSTLTLVVLTSTHKESYIICWESYYTVQCNGCKSVTFFLTWQCTEDDYMTPDGPELVVHEEYYPTRIVGRSILLDF
jgi:hypothetical protein